MKTLKPSWSRCAAAALWVCVVALPVFSQQRPLRTADAETLPPGTVRVEAGFDFLQDVEYPLAGLRGDLTSLGMMRARMGVGKLVEVQLEGAVRQFLDVQEQVPAFATPVLSQGNSTSDVGDWRFSTKIRVLSETARRPALAFRAGFQMPNTNQLRGIGLNTSNIFLDFIVQKHIGRLNLMGNVGLGILQAPAAHFTQNDVVTYGVAFTFPLERRVNLAGEVAGFHSPRRITPALVGTESRSQARLGLQIFAGGFSWDIAGIAGLTRHEARTGLSFGISREVRLFDYGSVK